VAEDRSNDGSPKTDQMRKRYGFFAILAGFLLVAVVTWVAIGRWSAASDVAAVVGLITSMIGTVIGAFFGIQVGAQGKEQAARNKAETKANVALAAVPADQMDTVLEKLPE
jgi:hypothetical protein